MHHCVFCVYHKYTFVVSEVGWTSDAVISFTKGNVLHTIYRRTKYRHFCYSLGCSSPKMSNAQLHGLWWSWLTLSLCKWTDWITFGYTLNLDRIWLQPMARGGVRAFTCTQLIQIRTLVNSLRPDQINLLLLGFAGRSFGQTEK